MRKIDFTKMVASGNDFVVIDSRVSQRLPGLASQLCNRKFGIGADGMLLLRQSKKADIRMRIFNADGSEAEMCGNGARCIALYLGKPRVRIETKTGTIESRVKADKVKIKLTAPKGIKLDIPIKIDNRNLNLNFIDTGVPHAVIFVEGLNKMDIVPLGRFIRYHKRFSPRGTNVDFLEVSGSNLISIRTYERGVEDETLACGTGAVAAALIFALKSETDKKINVHTKSGKILKVYFKKKEDKFSNVWLEGQAKIVYKGVYYV